MKSPVNLVLTAYTPERLFVDRLLHGDNAAVLKAWVKAPDVGFYGIEYGYQTGGNGRSKRGQFNPDFFLLHENSDEVIVVETKADDDFTDVNRGKLAYATAYFAKLNELLKAKAEQAPLPVPLRLAGRLRRLLRWPAGRDAQGLRLDAAGRAQQLRWVGQGQPSQRDRDGRGAASLAGISRADRGGWWKDD